MSTSSSLPPSPTVVHASGCPCIDCSYVAIPIGPSIKTLLAKHRGAGGKGFSGLKPIKIKLISSPVIHTGSPGGNLAFIQGVNLDTTNFPEYNNLAQLYDLVRLRRVKLWFTPYISTNATSAGQPSFGGVNIGFDSHASAPSTTGQVFEASHTSGPMCVGAPSNIGGNINPTVQHMHSLTAAPPRQIAPILSDTCMGQEWFPIDTTVTPVAFQYSMFWGTAGASAVVSIGVVREIELEFKLRT